MAVAADACELMWSPIMPDENGRGRLSVGLMNDLDARTVMSGHALWLLVNAGSLIAPKDAFRVSMVYEVLERLRIADWVWGSLMLVLSLAILAGIRARRNSRFHRYRGIVALYAGGISVLYGVLVCSGGFLHNYLSPNGMFFIILGIRVWIVSPKWALDP